MHISPTQTVERVISVRACLRTALIQSLRPVGFKDGCGINVLFRAPQDLLSFKLQLEDTTMQNLDVVRIMREPLARPLAHSPGRLFCVGRPLVEQLACSLVRELSLHQHEDSVQLFATLSKSVLVGLSIRGTYSCPTTNVQLLLKFAECLLPESSFVNERVAFTAH